MATVKKGILTRSPEWWKHLRWTKRDFWKRERRASAFEIEMEIAGEDGVSPGLKKMKAMAKLEWIHKQKAIVAREK